MVDPFNCCPSDNRRINLRIATQQTQRINQTQRKGAIQPGVNFYGKHFIATWHDSHGVKKTANFNIDKFGYEVAKQLAINKRNEMELSLNHYRIALHNLAPLELQELETDYDFEEVEGID